MSWLLTDEEFAEAAAAVRGGDVTPQLYAFIGRLVSADLRSGTVPPTLSASGEWDAEAIADATHDWLAEKLLRGALLQAFDRTAAPQALARYLERAFKNWLRDKGRSRSWPRILIRSREILDAGDQFKRFEEASRWLDHRYGLAAWGDPPRIEDEELVVRAVYGLPDLQIIRERGERAPTILSTSDLGSLLEHALRTVEGTITLSQLDRGFRHRFAWAFEAANVELEETSLEEVAQPTVSEAEAEEAAHAILADLTKRQLEMLRERADGATLEELAEIHSCSRGTADNELKRASAVIRRHLAPDESQERTLEILFALSFSERG
jgi:DNA-binding CsgD family transcriptional regulator